LVLCCVIILATCFDPWADPVFVGPEAYTIFGAFLRKIKNYEQKMYKSEYLFTTPPRRVRGTAAFLASR